MTPTEAYWLGFATATTCCSMIVLFVLVVSA
jgi:hypothetical protein